MRISLDEVAMEIDTLKAGVQTLRAQLQSEKVHVMGDVHGEPIIMMSIAEYDELTTGKHAEIVQWKQKQL